MERRRPRKLPPWRLTLLAGLILSLLLVGCDTDTSTDAGVLDGPPADTGSPDAGSDQSPAKDQLAKVDLPAMDLPVKPDSKPKVDLPAKDLSVKPDASVKVDGTSTFPKVLDGVWLVGWFGGLNRFSWVRFQVSSPSSGKAWILDGKGLSGGTVPYWNCSGATSWNLASKPNTVQLHFPSPTCTGYKSASYTFAKISAFSGTYPKGATHKADVQPYPGNPSLVQAYKFAASQCDSKMTKCTDPLVP